MVVGLAVTIVGTGYAIHARVTNERVAPEDSAADVEEDPQPVAEEVVTPQGTLFGPSLVDDVADASRRARLGDWVVDAELRRDGPR